MPADDLSKFLRGLQRLHSTRTRMETLYKSRRVTESDMDSVYEALFLRAVTSFEAFLEAQFLSILLGRANYKPGRVAVRMTATSRSALMDVLLQGDKYMTWLPFPHTEDRAKIFLKDGKPFTELTSGDRQILQLIVTTRHAIAHRSTHATKQFEKKVIGSMSMLPRERKPAGFLRSPLSAGTKQNRFDLYLIELGRVASFLG